MQPVGAPAGGGGTVPQVSTTTPLTTAGVIDDAQPGTSIVTGAATTGGVAAGNAASVAKPAIARNRDWACLMEVISTPGRGRQQF
jgi:hypothetical protein